MSESGGQSEPSMEDILASIRRILNEDGEPVDEASAASQAAPEASVPSPSAAQSQSNVDDVFELDQSMIVEEDMSAEPEPPPMLAPPASIPAVEENMPLLNDATAAAAGASLGALARIMDQQQRPVALYGGGPTLEDIVRQELRPLLKSWLDEQLPPMVERLVRAEIERVTAARG